VFSNLLFRYHGKSKALMYDVTKIISKLKGKLGEHRLFRLAENLCMNLILSLKDFFFVKKELKVMILLASLSMFDSQQCIFYELSTCIECRGQLSSLKLLTA
jgi:hypothetical protein